MKTAEEWLHRAVEHMDRVVFDGALGTDKHKFQIYFGRVKGKKGTETVQPSDNEAVTLEDFFPTTIGVDYQTQSIDKMLANLCMECIKAFMGITKGKAFNKKCKEYYFCAPFSSADPTPYLKDQLDDVRMMTERDCGEFPWKAIKFAVKEQKEKKSTKVTFFCPECGLEYTVSKKKLKETQGTPTCICGTKCGRDLSDEQQEESSADQD